MPGEPYHFKNRELSWLSFNERVLQEAADTSVPLLERLKFLGIFSSNLDEFFRIRVASLKRILKFDKKSVDQGNSVALTLETIYTRVIEQQKIFGTIYRKILKELSQRNIFLLHENELNPHQGQFVKAYFQQKVLPSLVPVMFDNVKGLFHLRDKSVYLAVRLHHSQKDKSKYAVIEIPNSIPRFLVLPDIAHKYIMLLDDVIRYCLDDIFYIFNYEDAEAWAIKLTRDAELEIDHDIAGTFVEKISQSLKKRKKGNPVRFSFDDEIPDDFLNFLIAKIQLDRKDLIPGGRYHNFKDFVNFPDLNDPSLVYPSRRPLDHPDLKRQKSIMKAVKKKDCMVHLPYQSFDYVIQFVREASIDPKVQSIKITLYRVAQYSNIIKALINAAKNGKSVLVCLELQARFDEKANIYWSRKLEEEGVKVIHGIQGLKIHSKMCLVTRKEGEKLVHYANLGTGNFHEGTAKAYCDHSFFTANPKITNEVHKVFNYIENVKRPPSFKHLLVSPFNLRKTLESLINQEIRFAQKGKKARIILKLNHIVDEKMIALLREACEKGVKIDIIARTTCSIIPYQSKKGGHISAISIIDKYLEHARAYIFHNGGDTLCFLSSADLMTRNLDYRIELAFPILDEEIKQDILNILDIQLNDNVKARLLNTEKENEYKRNRHTPKIRTHDAVYNYLKEKTN